MSRLTCGLCYSWLHCLLRLIPPLTTQTSVRIIHVNYKEHIFSTDLENHPQPMCTKSKLQQHIRNLTGDGEVVARFLLDTVQGEHPDAKYYHKLEAAKLLARYGSDQPESEETQFWGLIPTPEELSLSKREEDAKPEKPEREVTFLDILNYDIAHLIRQETAEGHTIAEFLSHVMTRRDQPFTPKKLRIRHTDRMAAAKEILRRGHGHWGRKPKLKVYADDVEDTNDYDTLHTDLAKRMREYNEHGTDAIRFLLDVMNDTSLDPEEGYTWHHKMSAAHEIIRRGWDTNYDKITPEMLQAYWQDQQSTRLSIGQKKQLAGLPTFTDEYDHYDTTDYQAIADEIRQDEDREEAQSEHPTKNPPLPAGEGWGEGPSESLPPHINSSFLRRQESSAGINSLPPRRGKARMGVNIPESSPSKNPTERENGKQNPLSPRERARVRGSEEPQLSQSSPPMSATADDETTFIDDLDCYYEPLTPEDQAIFNYNSLMESGEFEESEITFVPPSEAAHRDYAIALKQIREAAASEGVPLLPNPLAGTLRHPTIRSP